jgi:spore coat protein U-like protein
MTAFVGRGFLFAALTASLFAASEAYAAYSCSLSVTPISVSYDPTVATENITTGTVTVSCTRAASDANTFAYTATADNGLQANGSINRAQLGANRYSYELYRTPPYVNGNRWQLQNANRFSGTLSFGTSLSASTTHAFDLRVPGSQTVVPAGTYIDTVTSTLRNSAGTTVSTTAFNVSIITTNSCQITTAPGNINFAYTSFQPSNLTASTSFATRCTSGLPYTMTLDATGGTLLGLSYNLALSAGNATGTGIVQSFSINGSIAAGQAGTCATATCTGSQARVLTITY